MTSIKNMESETDIIRNWISRLPNKITPGKKISNLSLNSLESLIELYNSFSTSQNENQDKKSSKKKLTKIITQNGKNTVIVYQNSLKPFLEKYFCKKQLNSNWTYLNYRDYNIRWNCDIYVYEIRTEEPIVKQKKKKKVKKEESRNEVKGFSFDDFFDQISDDE